ncbi:MAG TPA: CvpA family protein [Flavobacterium sp.]|jgi:membrane protein required for colicin V production
MAFLDLILAILLALGLIRGLRNGLLVELASLVSLLVGIYAALKLSDIAKSAIDPHVSWRPETVSVAAFMLTFIIVVVGITLLARILTKAASLSGLGIFNSILGALFGTLKMLLILSVFVNFFLKFSPLIEAEYEEKSILVKPVQEVGEYLYPAFSEFFVKTVKKTSE